MTPLDIRAHLSRLDLSQASLADSFGCNRRTVQRWCDGDRPIPEIVARLLRLADRGLIERLRSA